MSIGNYNYHQSKFYFASCAKKAKDIKNTAKRNKEIKSKPEENKEIEK